MNSNTWSINELKTNGRINMSRAYWRSVLSAFVLAMALGATGTGAAITAVMRLITASSMNRYTDFVGMFLGVFLAIAAISAVCTICGYALGIFLLNPLGVGAQRFFIVNRVQDASVSEIGIAFRENYLNVVKTEFLRALYIFLWSLLFMIPGIVKGYEYRMVPYILAENPSIDSREAFRLSKAMMTGEKWNAFVLDLSFIGWHILSAFTLGFLDLFYTRPYQASTNAELYETLKARMFGNVGQAEDVAQGGAADAAAKDQMPDTAADEAADKTTADEANADSEE